VAGVAFALQLDAMLTGGPVQLRLLIPLLCLVACDETVSGQKPVGGNVDTEAEIQRYLRRAYLDLTGHVPSDADLAASTVRLQDAGNSVAAREGLVDELIAKQDFANVWIEELENGIFGGNTLDQQYALVCGIIRGTVPACNSCTETDSCYCNCGPLPMYRTEKESLAKTKADFMAGTKSSELERRYASAFGYFVLAGGPEGRVSTLFDDFLSRPAEPDEIENGRSMIFGALFPGSPAGLMFHRHGSSYDDLIDIVFESEVYRESMVRRVFGRYLAHEPSSAELAFFTPTLDATAPDVRPLVRAVLSSREYFEQ
jgi:hypothetical protein